jgi:ABC-type sugar transport system permease subunit
LAGLQSVPSDCLESASIDGCGRVSTFTRVILPIVSPTILVVTLLSIINALSQTGIILVLTRGGPVRATETLSLYLYNQAFINFQFSAAATISMVLMVVNLTVVAIYLYVSKRNREVIS